MKIRFRASFLDDARRIADADMRRRISTTIQRVEQAATLGEVAGLKRLHAAGSYYRIRVGMYRIGILLDGETVEFIRCLNRKDIYRYFP